MNRSRKLAVVMALAAGVAAPLAGASAAQAVGTVSHDGCKLTVDTPAFTNHWTTSGVKQVDYTYHLTCDPSAVGVSVEVTLERWESDIFGAPGDPNAPDDFNGTTSQTKIFTAAGGTQTHTTRAALPVTDDTDGNQEMYQRTRFRVTNGAVTGTWSSWNLSNAQRIFN